MRADHETHRSFAERVGLARTLSNRVDASFSTGNGSRKKFRHRFGRVRRIDLQGSYAEGIVTLRIEDSGPGIPDDVAKRLFEPFVTSKPDGMGLGLAISRSLVRARGGELSFAPSTALGGASFTVRLPIEIPADTPLV